MQAVNKNPTASEVRTFGYIMLGGFAFLGAALWRYGRLPETGWSYSHTGIHTVALVMWCAGIIFAVICSASHTIGKRLYVVWMTGAMVLGVVTSTILLSVLFFVLLPLFSLIRLKDPLRFKLNSAGSYWEEHKPYEATLDRMRRPF